MSTLVSVILSNYNYDRYVGQSIDSVLKQTYANFELIVVDDGSTDRSIQVIGDFRDDRIRVVLKNNGGQASAFNAGFALAKGQIVAFLDSDDTWKPDKLERVIEAFRSGNYSVVQHNLEVIDGNSKGMGRVHPGIRPGVRNVVSAYFDEGRTGFFSATSGIACRRSDLDRIFPLDESWRICADVAVTRPLALFGPVCTVSDVLGHYRIHGANSWMNTDRQQLESENERKYVEYTNQWLARCGYAQQIELRAESHDSRRSSTHFSELNLLSSYHYMSKEPVLIDVGAHRGTFSSAFARKRWQVIAFEPEAENRAVLERNLGQFERVTCDSRAVSDVSGRFVPFYVSDKYHGIHSLQPFDDSHTLAFEVETVRLDEMLGELSVREVSLLKIDAEGADFLALQSFDFKAIRPELVMVEFMDGRSLEHFGYDHHDMVAFMLQYEYSTFVSEWEPIVEYGKRDGNSVSHRWIQCVSYPLDHDPAWGNLIFVPDEDARKFEAHLEAYLLYLRRSSMRVAGPKFFRSSRVKQLASRIPGSLWLYRHIRRILANEL